MKHLLLIASLAAALLTSAADATLFEIRAVATEGQEVELAKARGAQKSLKLAKEVLLDTTHIASASVEKDSASGQDQVRVTLTPEGRKRFAEVTKKNIGKQLAVVVNKKVLIAPVINSEIPGGEVVITGNFSPEEAQELAKTLAPAKK